MIRLLSSSTVCKDQVLSPGAAPAPGGKAQSVDAHYLLSVGQPSEAPASTCPVLLEHCPLGVLKCFEHMKSLQRMWSYTPNYLWPSWELAFLAVAGARHVLGHLGTS